MKVIPHDKANHIVYGALAGALGSFVASLVGHETWVGAILFAAVIGIGKEVYDRVSGKGSPTVPDALATIAGGLLVAVGAL